MDAAAPVRPRPGCRRRGPGRRDRRLRRPGRPGERRQRPLARRPRRSDARGPCGARASRARAPRRRRRGPGGGGRARRRAVRRCSAERGYRRIRASYRMGIDLRGTTFSPAWPPGAVVRTSVEGVDEPLLHRINEESFADHWGHTPTPYEEWLHWLRSMGEGDPSLWFVAEVDGVPAGVAICRPHDHGDPDCGWVSVLGVLREHRRTGLGTALLTHAFAELQRRGRLRAGLGVDAESTTGAVGLYERAGMSVLWRWDIWERERMSARLEIAPFGDEHLADASVLLAARHARQRLVEPLLSAAFENPDAARTELEAAWRSEGASGAAALEDGRLVGYLVGAPRRGTTWGPERLGRAVGPRRGGGRDRPRPLRPCRSWLGRRRRDEPLRRRPGNRPGSSRRVVASRVRTAAGPRDPRGTPGAGGAGSCSRAHRDRGRRGRDPAARHPRRVPDLVPDVCVACRTGSGGGAGGAPRGAGRSPRGLPRRRARRSRGRHRDRRSGRVLGPAHGCRAPGRRLHPRLRGHGARSARLRRGALR